MQIMQKNAKQPNQVHQCPQSDPRQRRYLSLNLRTTQIEDKQLIKPCSKTYKRVSEARSVFSPSFIAVFEHQRIFQEQYRVLKAYPAMF